MRKMLNLVQVCTFRPLSHVKMEALLIEEASFEFWQLGVVVQSLCMTGTRWMCWKWTRQTTRSVTQTIRFITGQQEQEGMLCGWMLQDTITSSAAKVSALVAWNWLSVYTTLLLLQCLPPRRATLFPPLQSTLHLTFFCHRFLPLELSGKPYFTW